MDRTVEINIKNAVFVYEGQLLHIGLECRVGLVIRYEDQLLDRVEHSVVLAHLHPDLPLMPAAVHIPIDHKPHILRLVHIQYLDIVVLIVAPGIIPVIKAEKVRHLFVGRVITKQLLPVDKGKIGSAVALHQLHLVIPDAEHDAVAAVHVRIRLEELVHGALIVEQIYPVRRVTHPVKLNHAVRVPLPALQRLHPVVHADRCRLRFDLADDDVRFGYPGDVQIRPCDLL